MSSDPHTHRCLSSDIIFLLNRPHPRLSPIALPTLSIPSTCLAGNYHHEQHSQSPSQWSPLLHFKASLVGYRSRSDWIEATTFFLSSFTMSKSKKQGADAATAPRTSSHRHRLPGHRSPSPVPGRTSPAGRSSRRPSSLVSGADHAAMDRPRPPLAGGAPV